VREAQQVYLPIIVLAELYFGAEKSPDPERKRQQIDRFLPLVEVLQTTAQTARKYGVIKAELEARGETHPG
jgi:tRNA(fMet)-specific endonuclease VapC